jgi:preprotein translocase SecE subunit
MKASARGGDVGQDKTVDSNSGQGKAASQASANGSAAKGEGFANYLSECVEELRRISTPTRQETTQATVVTLFIMFFVSLCLFLLDLVFSQLMLALVQ